MRSLLILVVLLLAACATPPARLPADDPQAAWHWREQRLARIDAWDLRGRLAISAEQQAGNASFHWVRQADRNRLTLAAPFGGGRVRVVYDAEQAALTDGRGEVYYGASVQELLARATGWRLPLQALEHWVLGLPAPGEPGRRELDAWGRLETLEQAGWRIEFVEYVAQGGYEVPRRIFIRRERERFYGESLEARFVIERWSLHHRVAAYATP